VPTPKRKRCGKCTRRKKLGEFNAYAKGKHGKSSLCRVCDNAASRKYYAKHRKRMIARVNKHRVEHLECYRAYSRKARAGLRPAYVAAKLSLSLSKCGPELLEAKRNQIKFRRFMKAVSMTSLNT